MGSFTGRAGGWVYKIPGGTMTGVLGGGGPVTVGPGGGWVMVTVKVGEKGGISLGERTGRDKVGLTGRGEDSSLSISLPAGFREAHWTSGLSIGSLKGTEYFSQLARLVAVGP